MSARHFSPTAYLPIANQDQLHLHLLIPSDIAPSPPASTTTTLSAQSPVGPSAAGPSAAGLPVIRAEPAEADLRAVGSPQLQQAANKRRKKAGMHQCPFRNTGCNATFTAPHNLRYHMNSHLGLKPYKCKKCPYAAAFPPALKRHRATCKGTGQTTQSNA